LDGGVVAHSYLANSPLLEQMSFYRRATTLGQTLYTTPAEIYRALIEATAFGTLTIINRFEEYGVKIRQVVNCGGIAEKNPVVMQIYEFRGFISPGFVVQPACEIRGSGMSGLSGRDRPLRRAYARSSAADHQRSHGQPDGRNPFGGEHESARY